jgi:hypothetical protein
VQGVAGGAVPARHGREKEALGTNAVVASDEATLAVRLRALVRGRGTAAHPHAAGLRAADARSRDLADAVHALCAVHGTHPGLADLLRALPAPAPVAAWAADTADFFADERAFLARLCVAAGPLPSTPHHDASEAALAAQRYALSVLGCSARPGCAVGVVAAALLDWGAVRPVLDHAARRFGVAAPVTAPPPCPDAALTALSADAMARAAHFGADQLLAQHQGLWSLLEARAGARTA